MMHGIYIFKAFWKKLTCWIWWAQACQGWSPDTCPEMFWSCPQSRICSPWAAWVNTSLYSQKYEAGNPLQSFPFSVTLEFDLVWNDTVLSLWLNIFTKVLDVCTWGASWTFWPPSPLGWGPGPWQRWRRVCPSLRRISPSSRTKTSSSSLSGSRSLSGPLFLS